MSMEDVQSFAIKNHVTLSEEELKFTYEFVKKNWRTILGNPNSFSLERYRDRFSEENFQKINRLIKEYRIKYQAFL